MNVKAGCLAANRLDHVGMAMPDIGHVVVDIQVTFAVGTIQPDGFALHEMERFLVEQRCLLAYQSVSAFEEIVRHDVQDSFSHSLLLRRTVAALQGFPGAWNHRRQ
ncbi:hypothetical protein D3C78_1642980 [compost metagenome]